MNIDKTEKILNYMAQHPIAWRGRPLAQAVFGKDISTEEVTRVMALLKYLSDQGRLVRCKIETPGQQPQFEYRISAAGSAAKNNFRNYPAAPKPVSPEIVRGGATLSPKKPLGGSLPNLAR